MKKNNRSFFLYFFSFISCLVSMISCILINTNSNLNSLIFLSVVKGIPMLFVILIATINLKNNKNINIYKKMFLFAFFMSFISDVTLVFNVIIGGIFSIFAMLFLIITFFKHHSFKILIFKKRKEFNRQLLAGLISLVLSFCFFMIYSFIFVYPEIPQKLFILKLLFPVYMLFLSVAVGASFFGKTPFLVRFAIILFFVSDSLLFYGFSFGFSPLLTFSNLTLYYCAQNIFAFKIND